MRVILVALFIALALAGCLAQSQDVTVDNVWIRLAAVPGQPAAGYFTLHGAATDDKLIAVHNENAIKVELHESMTGMPDMNGMAMSEMKPLTAVPVPAGSKIIFAPGGKHVMLFGLSPAVKRGSTTQLTLVFKSGLQVAENATVVAAGDAAPYKK
jgi:copper(I)-binding protein